MNGQQPHLTIVATGRNDGYGGDFVARFLRTLAFNAHELAARQVPTEFVFVEWAPPDDRPLLTELALDALPWIAPVLRAIVVDRQYHEALTMNPRITYLEFLAKNVGVRRARGTLVLTTNADVCLGRHVLGRLADRTLDRRVVYRARRVDLKLGLDQSAMDWAVLEDERNYDTGLKALRPPLYSGGTGDFVLLDRESFAELRGFNEVYRVAKIGIDRNFLVKALHAGVPIDDIGGPVYHINHAGSYRMSKGLYRDRQDEAPYGDRRWPSSVVVYENTDLWGLGAAPAEQVSPAITRLAFDWAAVPPLVDLARVMRADRVEDADDET